MAKKIYDIVPPKARHKAEAGKKAETVHKHAHTKHAVRHNASSFPFLRVAYISGAVVIILLAVFLYFKLQRVEVSIWPKTEILNFEEKITADKSADAVDPVKGIIPAQFIEDEKELSQEFQATGESAEDTKAGGTIKVFNNETSSVTLKIGTHFLSDSGKYFISLSRIVIPAGKKSGSKVTPGSVDVKVQAVEAGSGSNIGPAKFSVPKLAGNPLYYSVYASSSASMSGGSEKDVRQVSEKDVDDAETAVTEKAREQLKESLKSKITGEQILLDDALLIDILESSPSVKVGTAASNFNYQVKLKGSALVIKKEDLRMFVKDYLLSRSPAGNTILDESIWMDYSVDSADLKTGKMTIKISFSGKNYAEINKETYVSSFRQKTENQIINEVSADFGENVSKVDVKLWPFWTMKAPSEKEKIRIKLHFD